MAAPAPPMRPAIEEYNSGKSRKAGEPHGSLDLEPRSYF